MGRSLNSSEEDPVLVARGEEPALAPGHIQPFGVLLAFEIHSGTIAYASENIAEVLDRPPRDLLGRNIDDVLDQGIRHSLKNAAQIGDIDRQRHFVTTRKIRNQSQTVYAFRSGAFLVVEIEPGDREPAEPMGALQDFGYLVSRILSCKDRGALLARTVKLLRDTTGFERVLTHEFQPNGHVAVVAEARRRGLKPLLHHLFPSADIPAQVLETAMKNKLRVAPDATRETIPIQTDRPDRPGLDLTLAETHGVSQMHIQHLGNMHSTATMTLSIVIDNRLWGLLSFHHPSPRLCTPRIRQMLLILLPVLELKLAQLLEHEALAISRRMDDLQLEIRNAVERGVALSTLLQGVAPRLFGLLDVQGIAIISGSRCNTAGDAPDPATIETLVDRARRDGGEWYETVSLKSSFPDLAGCFGALAGTFILPCENDRALALFRSERSGRVVWAGDLETSIEVSEGFAPVARPSGLPRDDTSMASHCAPWSQMERHACGRLWPLLTAKD